MCLLKNTAQREKRGIFMKNGNESWDVLGDSRKCYRGPWAEIRKYWPGKEPIRLQDSLPCHSKKKNNLRYYSCHANIKFISIFFFIVLLLFGKCIYIFVVYHNKFRGHLIIPYHKQAKFIQKSLKWRELKRRRSISRPLMLHNKNTPLGSRMWWSYWVYKCCSSRQNTHVHVMRWFIFSRP